MGGVEELAALDKAVQEAEAYGYVYVCGCGCACP